MKQSVLKYIKWLLPVLFITYYGSVSLFMHVHIEYGVTIVHAHPFKTASDGGVHHHASLAEIQLFHYLTSIHAADGSVHPLQLQFYAVPLFKISGSPVHPEHLRPVQGGPSLRAPPAFA